jgi:hypothetical protein
MILESMVAAPKIPAALAICFFSDMNAPEVISGVCTTGKDKREIIICGKSGHSGCISQ